MKTAKLHKTISFLSLSLFGFGAGLSAQSIVLFEHDFDIADFGGSPGTVISATLPAGGGQTGAFNPGRVASIESVSIELSHSWSEDIFFQLTAPDGGTFSLIDVSGSLDFGDGGSDLDGLFLYTFVESGHQTVAELGGTLTGEGPYPAGTYRANTWQSAPEATGYWEAGQWTLSLSDRQDDDDGAVGRITVRGTLIPEPSSVALMMGCGGLLFAFSRRRKQG